MITYGYSKWLKKNLGKSCKKLTQKENSMMLTIQQTDLIAVISFLKKMHNCQFTVLTDITGLDYPTRTNRFEVAYILLSTRFSQRLIVKVETTSTKELASITSVYKAASWIEREVFDFFGIFFRNHPDLRRILTDYGFEGYPLRKDFPLTGFIEVRYESAKKRVSNEPLELTQNFRVFTSKDILS